MKTLQEILNIQYPLILAPMFLVSNTAMVIEGMKMGVAGCIPALNYRTIDELVFAIEELKAAKTENGAFGFNLIVNQSNHKYPSQLDAICEHGADFIITSLGNPAETIRRAHEKNIKVFCDVTNLEHAKKVESLGADAFIAVNNQAGGHRGDISAENLISSLKINCNLPVISAGGVGNHQQMQEIMNLGIAGISVGSPFIASKESSVSNEYKQACVDYGAQDIVMTKKISGTPCTVINTPYVQKIGTETTWLENLLNKNKRLKKYVKSLRFLQGTNAVTKAATQATYKTVWVAGPSIEQTKSIESTQDIIRRILGLS